MRQIKIFLCLTLIIFILTPAFAYAWSPVTHYHISKEAYPNLFQDEDEQEIFCLNSTGPDMICFWPLGKDSYPIKQPDGDDYDWADFFHSPDPKIKRNGDTPYWYKPNFAYLMLKAAGYPDSISSLNKAYALGWGGHIAADWVAHNKNLFAICPKGSWGEKKHLLGESIYDLYVFITRGPIGKAESIKMKFNPSLIYKALANYRLIAEHEENLGWSDERVKQEALNTTLPKSFIEERCRKWVKKLSTIQKAYNFVTLGQGKASSLGLSVSEGAESSGMERNLALSREAVRFWVGGLPPRNSIPDYNNLVVPYFSKPLAYNFNHPTDVFASFWNRLVHPFATNFAFASTESINAEDDTSKTQAFSADEIIYGFWEDAAEEAELAGILKTQEETNEEGELIVTASITDEEKFKELFIRIVTEKFSNSENPEEKRFAGLWKNLIIDEITDLEKLMDLTPPSISNLSPQDSSFTNNSTPEISACVLDNEEGIGIEKDSLTFKLNSENLNFSYDEETGKLKTNLSSPLTDKEYEVYLKVSDKAGNETEKRWKFTVDTIPPKLNYLVLNKLINQKKETLAKVWISSNEPAFFLIEIFRVKENLGKRSEKVFELKVSNLTQEFTFFWNGKDNEKNLVPNGVYEVKVTATDKAGNESFVKTQVVACAVNN